MAVPKNAKKSSVDIIDPTQGEALPVPEGVSAGGEEAAVELSPPESPPPSSREAGVPDKSPAADPEDPVELEMWFASVPEDARGPLVAYVKGLRGKTAELEGRASRLHDTLISDKPDYAALLEEAAAEKAAIIEDLQQKLAELSSRPDTKPDLDKAQALLANAVMEIAALEDERASWGEKEKMWGEKERGWAEKEAAFLKDIGDYDNGFEEVVRFALHGFAPELAMDDSAPEEFVRELIDAAKSMVPGADVPTKMGGYSSVAKRMATKRGMKPAMPAQFVLAAPSMPDPADISGNEPLADRFSDPKNGSGYKELARRLKQLGVG